MPNTHNKKLPAHVNVRMTDDMANMVRQIAIAKNKSDAGVVRKIIADSFKDIDIHVEAVPVARRRVSRPAPEAQTLAIAALRETLGELSGTLRQVAGLSRKDGHAANHQAIEELLPRIRQGANFLDDLKAGYEGKSLGDFYDLDGMQASETTHIL
jgi:hypothetical protein